MKQRIKEKYDELSAKEKKVAKYIIDNYQQSMLLSSSELARFAGVSDTAVVRFAKALGYKGFLDYKKNIKKEYIPTQKVYSSLSLIDHNHDGKILGMYLNSLHNDISTFLNNIDINRLTEMSREIINADIVYLIGFGSDEVVVNFLRNYLNIMGIQCISITEEGLALREKLFLLNSNDVVFMASYPTMMDSEVWVADYTRKKGAKLLLMTDSEITAEHLKADNFVAFYETFDNFFNSYVLQMAYCNALLWNIYELYSEKTTESMKAYHEMLSGNE